MVDLSGTTAQTQEERLLEYRGTDREKMRAADLMALLPQGMRSVLDVGAREGHFSRLLTRYFPEVTALDLNKPTLVHPGVTTVTGDVMKLAFPDEAFDCVFCAEVLEHIPGLQEACGELSRVTKHELVIGVPFQQDIRAGRTTCGVCRRPNPPWGHVNAFDETRLTSLFPSLRLVRKSFVAQSHDATNRFCTVLMDWAGNPWGSYNQDERCVFCDAKLIPPDGERRFLARCCSATASRINQLQRSFSKPHAQWIHAVFTKDM